MGRRLASLFLTDFQLLGLKLEFAPLPNLLAPGGRPRWLRLGCKKYADSLSSGRISWHLK